MGRVRCVEWAELDAFQIKVEGFLHNSALSPQTGEMIPCLGLSIGLDLVVNPMLAQLDVSTKKVILIRNQGDMMQSLNSKPYIVRSGDTFHSIARQFGFTNWADIYNNPANAALRTRRPDPNQLRPGDQIMIPPSAQMVRQVLQQRLFTLTHLRQQSDELFQKIEDDLKNNLAGYKRVAANADAAATVLQLFTGVVSIAAKGWSALKLSGPALDAANEELAKQGVKLATDPLQDVGLEIAAKQLGAHDGIVWAVGKISIESFLNIQSPSWWAGVVGNLQDGKSWSQAVTISPEEQLQANLNQVEAQRQQVLRSVDAQINATRALLQGLGDKGLVSLYPQG
jgi:hypothetical protein